MSEKHEMQADGSGSAEREGPAPGKVGSESSGAAYPNPHTGKDSEGFDGGQSDKSYRGPENPNATTD